MSGDVAKRAGLLDIDGMARENLAGAEQGGDVVGLRRARDIVLDAGAQSAASV